MERVCSLKKLFTDCEDDCSDIIVEAGCSDSLLMSFWRASFIAEDESRTDPDCTSSEHECGC